MFNVPMTHDHDSSNSLAGRFATTWFVVLTTSLIWADFSGVTAAESSVVIERCSVFDPESGELLPERTIVVRNERIVSVTGADATDKISGDAIRIDGHGKFALPGLIDAHVHVVHVL